MGPGRWHPASAFISFTPNKAPTPGTRASWLHLSASSPDLPTHISDGVPTRLSEILRLLFARQDLGWEAAGMGRGHWVPRDFVSHLWDPACPCLPPVGICLGPQLSCPSPRCSRAESVELKPGHG